MWKCLRSSWKSIFSKDNDVDNRPSMFLHPGFVNCRYKQIAILLVSNPFPSLSSSMLLFTNFSINYFLKRGLLSSEGSREWPGILEKLGWRDGDAQAHDAVEKEGDHHQHFPGSVWFTLWDTQGQLVSEIQLVLNISYSQQYFFLSIIPD